MEETKLSNQAEIVLTGNWALPIVGTPGTIQNKDAGNNGYLSTDGSIAKGSAVENTSFVANDDGQQWERSADDDSGYFTLMNPISGKFLAKNNIATHLTIEGNVSFFVLLFLKTLFFYP